LAITVIAVVHLANRGRFHACPHRGMLRYHQMLFLRQKNSASECSNPSPKLFLLSPGTYPSPRQLCEAKRAAA